MTRQVPLQRGELSGKRCLVTGGTGFIGGRLAERLASEQGAKVRVVARNLARSSRVARCPVELVQGDVTDAAFLERAASGCDVLFHCAYGNSGTLDDMRRVNVEGARNVLDAGVANSARVVNVGTLSVYGLTPDGDLDETATRRPDGEMYAESKLAAEELTLRYVRERGLQATVIQPAVVYGPFGPGWTVRILDEMRAGPVLLVNGGSGLCNAVYVDDLVGALIAAATRPEAIGEVFLVSGAAPVTWRDFYERFERMLGLQATESLSVHDAEARWEEKTRRSGILSESLALLRADKPLRQRIRATKEVDLLLRATCTLLPPGVRRLVRKSLGGETSPSTNPSTTPPLHLLPPRALRFFASKTRVKIDKANRLLGYQPAHDLDAGMKKTAAWASWANLLEKPR